MAVRVMVTGGGCVGWRCARLAALVFTGALVWLAVLAPSVFASSTQTGIQAILPANAGAGPAVSLSSVSCALPGNCAAVGSYTDKFGGTQGLLLSESSGSWASGVEVSPPGDANLNFNVSPLSVSCASAGNCTAVGDYLDSPGDRGLLLSESSGSWAAGVEASLPANANLNPGVFLSAVSCASAGNCTAVGRYTDSAGDEQGLLLSESAGSWATGIEATLPANAGADPSVGLSSVSCASPGDCAAVGSYLDSSGHTQGLLLSESSGSWATGLQVSPPGNASANRLVNLSSVSCASAGNCTAVGSYLDSSGLNMQALLVGESSGSWATGMEASLPANAGGGPDVGLGSVSCAAAGDCTAVGRYTDSLAHTQGLLLSESSGSWATGVQATPPANAGANSGVSLISVSCTAAGDCTTVGSYLDSSGHRQGLLLNESSGSWAIGVQVSSPANAGADPAAFLGSVSCAAAGDCTAVGNYTDSLGHRQGLLVTASVASPSVSVSAPASGTVGGAITAASVSATLSSGSAPTGTITFKVFGPQPSPPGSCSSGGTAGGSTTVSGNATYHPPVGFTPASAGDYWWYATYSGDSTDKPVASACGASMPETVVTANPRLSVTTPASGIVGTTIAASSISAALSSGSAPTGLVTLKVFGPQPSPPGSCSSGGIPVGSTTVSGNATYHPSAGFTPVSAGDYWWYASYGGDTANDPAASACGSSMAKTSVSSAPAPITSVPGKVGTLGAKLKFTFACRGAAGQICSGQATATTIEKLSANGKTITGVLVARPRSGRYRVVTILKGSLSTATGQRKDISIGLNSTGQMLRNKFKNLPADVKITATASGLTSTIRAAKVTFGPDSPRTSLAAAPATKHDKLRFDLRCKGPSGQVCRGSAKTTTFEKLGADGRTITGLSYSPSGRGKLVTLAVLGWSLRAGNTKLTVAVEINARGRSLLSKFGKIPATLTITPTYNGYTLTPITAKITFKR